MMFGTPSFRGIPQDVRDLATQEAHRPLTDDEIDEAFDLAANLSQLQVTNRIRAKHNLAPLTAQDIFDECRTDALNKVHRIMDKGVTR